MTTYRTYRAPRENGEALIEPALADCSRLLASNRANSAAWTFDLCGVPFDEVRQAARDELVRDAVRYTSAYRQVIDLPPDAAIVMAGHQPTLFHPGVWFKNFVLDEVANRAANVSVIGINLVIDNDAAATAAVRVPVIDRQTHTVTGSTVVIDSALSGVPYEQTRIRDRDVFDSFGVRLAEAIAPLESGPLEAGPLVRELWPFAQAAAVRCENVACALAQARHALEGTLGLRTLEVPISVVCRSESFAAFTLSILNHLVRFRSIYNDAVIQYRQAHGIRSNAHPVPELAAEDDWIEAPLWLYGDDSPQRRGVWVRQVGEGIEISDRRDKSFVLDRSRDRSAAAALAAQGGSNWKLRPRALLTTMYARMVLCDLFMHGIGGAKYDQLGDQILKRFYGVEPNEMMVVSATLQLPVADEFADARTPNQVRRRLRDLRFAPDTFPPQSPAAVSLVKRKRELLARIPASGSKRNWHVELTRVNQQLSELLSGERAELETALATAIAAASANSILRSREYSFALFNLESLVNRYRQMLGAKW